MTQTNDLANTCGKCQGSGQYIARNRHTGKQQSFGHCFQCKGKGYMNDNDIRRTELYWERRGAGTMSADERSTSALAGQVTVTKLGDKRWTLDLTTLDGSVIRYQHPFKTKRRASEVAPRFEQNYMLGREPSPEHWSQVQ